jgi:hypothetical protein
MSVSKLPVTHWHQKWQTRIMMTIKYQWTCSRLSLPGATYPLHLLAGVITWWRNLTAAIAAKSEDLIKRFYPWNGDQLLILNSKESLTKCTAESDSVRCYLIVNRWPTRNWKWRPVSNWEVYIKHPSWTNNPTSYIIQWKAKLNKLTKWGAMSDIHRFRCRLRHRDNWRRRVNLSRMYTIIRQWIIIMTRNR